MTGRSGMMASARRRLRALVVPALVALAVAATCTAAGAADSVADFYRGKSLRLIIGSAPGGAYDIAGRIIATHMGRHIPGAPTIVVEDMPGAASLVMANYFYNRAPHDGTVIGMPNSNILLEPRLKILSRSSGNAQFDISRFGWLGSAVQEPQVFWVVSSTPVRDFKELKDQKVAMAATAVGADNYTLPLVVNEIFGTHLQPVTGYRGSSEFFIAAERGEVQGAVGALSNLTVNQADGWRSGKFRVLMQFGSERNGDIKATPTAIELAATEADRQMLRFIALKFSLARALLLPPDVPAAQTEALRAAFDATMSDPGFLDAARKLGIDIDPLDHRAIQRLIGQVDGTPDEVVDRLRNLIASASKDK
jgi:tripartite-type tricarboxylate transporter receptor subunit TctC